MLFNLFVIEFEDLQSVRHGGLSGLSFMEVVDNSLVGESLLQISVAEVYYRVAVCESLSSYLVAEDNFFLAVQVDSLNFAVCTGCFALDGGILRILVVILKWHAQVPLITTVTAFLRLLLLQGLRLFRNFNFESIFGAF